MALKNNQLDAHTHNPRVRNLRSDAKRASIRLARRYGKRFQEDAPTRMSFRGYAS